MRPKEPPNENEVLALRTLISQFVGERLFPKLEEVDKKIAKALELADPNSRESLEDLENKREKLLTDYHMDTWLLNAANRVGQIQRATHAIKFSHQDAKGSSLDISDSQLIDEPTLVGSHLPHTQQNSDVVGNAAALDVHKFLKLEYEGRSLLERILAGESGMAEALSEDPEQAEMLMSLFAGITGKDRQPSSHKLAKQVYFPLPDGGYHLLAPLFPTSLIHAVYGKMRDDRFSEETKQARAARRNDTSHPHGFRDYPGLAVQVFGGTKPQNISQLNSERHGENWLLPSCPPLWRNKPTPMPLGPTSIFQWGWFGKRGAIADRFEALADFLGKTDYTNIHIRRHRARLVQGIVDEVLHFASEIQAQPPGWTADGKCRLNQEEALWLDPGRAETDEGFAALYSSDDWQDKVAHRFANWFNARLRAHGKRHELPMGEAEAAEWQKLLEKELRFLGRELAHA